MQVKNLKGFPALAFLAFAAFSVPAFADTVIYSTTGTFTGSAGSFVSFTGQTDTNVFAPTVAHFGALLAGTAAYTPAAGDGFKLTVSQSDPLTADTETLSDTFTGKITSGAQSTLILTLDGGSGASSATLVSAINSPTTLAAWRFTLGGVTYYIDQVTPIGPHNGGASTIEGYISDTPEPALYSLTATGFAGLLFMAIRRRRQSQA